MRCLVLCIGCRPEQQGDVQGEWQKYGIAFDFVANLSAAVEKLAQRDYICAAFCSNFVLLQDIDALHRIRQIPVMALLSDYDATQRYECDQQEGVPHISSVNQCQIADPLSKNNMRYCLELSGQERPSLTIIAVKDLCFCLEYRSVEVRGQSIHLTAKEFDILTLLISHQRRVFTYEMIMDLIWHEDYSYYSRKAINNHISNLRKKLKVAPDVPDYIKSVHSVGYKFDTD